MTTVSVLFGGGAVDGFQDLAVVSGTVVKDRKAATKGRTSLTIAEPTLLPVGEIGDPFAPIGFELVVRRGLVIAGEAEMKQLGVFPLQRSTLEATTLLTSVSAVDRSQLVIDADLEDVYEIDAGTNFGTAIRDLIGDGVPSLEYAFASTELVTPHLLFPAFSGRWKQAQLMAASIGMELFFDGLGRCTLRPEPTNVSGSPVWTLTGGDGGTLTALSIDRDRGPTFNRVVATGQNSSNTEQYRAVATDDDPASPSYYYGPFGRKPIAFTSSLIGSGEQAALAAEARLVRQLGVAKSLRADGVPNPAIEDGDLILFREDRTGTNERHLADVITTGLGVTDVQTFETRAWQEAA